MSWLFFSVSPSELRAIVLLTTCEYHLESLASPEIYDLVSVWCGLSGTIQFFTLLWKALPWETCTECTQGSRPNLCPPLGLFPNPTPHPHHAYARFHRGACVGFPGLTSLPLAIRTETLLYWFWEDTEKCPVSYAPALLEAEEEMLVKKRFSTILSHNNWFYQYWHYCSLSVHGIYFIQSIWHFCL